MATREERERRTTYDARYRSDILDANLQVEREAVGSDYGNNFVGCKHLRPDFASH